MSNLAEKAEGPIKSEDLHRSITEGILNQRDKGKIIEFLDDDEQPHYIAELHNDCEWRGSSVHVVLSDKYLRIISSSLNVNIQYKTITNAWLERNGAMIRLNTEEGVGVDDAYDGDSIGIGYDSLRGHFHNHKNETKSALEFIKRQQQQTEEKSSDSNIERIRELSKLKEEGIISEQEFNEKKSELLDGL